MEAEKNACGSGERLKEAITELKMTCVTLSELKMMAPPQSVPGYRLFKTHELTGMDSKSTGHHRFTVNGLFTDG